MTAESARDEALRFPEHNPANDEAIALIEQACNGKFGVLIDYETFCIPLKMSHVVRLIALARQRPGWVLPCGHPSACNVLSAETGEILYCGWCNAVSFQRDLTTDQENLAKKYWGLLEEASEYVKELDGGLCERERPDLLKRIDAAAPKPGISALGVDVL